MNNAATSAKAYGLHACVGLRLGMDVTLGIGDATALSVRKARYGARCDRSRGSPGSLLEGRVELRVSRAVPWSNACRRGARPIYPLSRSINAACVHWLIDRPDAAAEASTRFTSAE